MATPSMPPEPESRPTSPSRVMVEGAPGQSVVIGDGVEIALLDIEDDEVHIAVIAPEHVQVVAGEVYRDRGRRAHTRRAQSPGASVPEWDGAQPR